MVIEMSDRACSNIMRMPVLSTPFLPFVRNPLSLFKFKTKTDPHRPHLVKNYNKIINHEQGK